MSKKAIIIGAGPAGLTAAYELLKSTGIKPVILEKSGDIGGISKTINYKGNRMDIGGHRFFSKSDRVMKWWLNIMPIQKIDETYTTITYQRKQRTIVQEETHLHANPDDKLVMLVRKRLSRIYFLRKFFTYPIQLSFDTLQKLGLFRTLNILLSYLYAQLIPRKPEKSLEDFLINRFGRQLYLLFFKDYTEKVWGVPCNEISAEWGAQRIKGVSISKAIQHAAQTMFKKKKGSTDISQKDTETSLIEQFLYPALGPGQLWEEVARQIEVLGGTILMNQDVKEVNISNGKVNSAVTINSVTGEKTEYEGDYFFSTMPVQELIVGMNGQAPEEVQYIAAGLQYRDFITVGVLLENTKSLDLKDTWIYIQEKDVKVGRLQLFNNWSPYMVNKPGTQWIGMEYFCNQNDDFWSLSDEEIKRIAVAELEKMGLAQVQDVLDSTVHRVEKTYPAYFGTYNQFDKIRSFVDQIENLFLVGRNGMHKYNNADHSMLTAMTAVDNIRAGITSKENIWAINTEQEYHEEKSDVDAVKRNVAGKSVLTSKDEKQALEVQPTVPFKSYVFNDKQNKILLRLAGIGVVLQFVLFKYFYPFPSFISDDSYVYLETAYRNFAINTYPIGYSNFLRILSSFTRSHTFTVACQYFLLQASQLTLAFTLFYFYRPSNATKNWLLFALIFNPALLYIANYISSDNLFISLSLLWIATLFWILYRPNSRVIIYQSILLFLVFTVRYNALIYPALTVGVFIFSHQSLARKVVGPLLGVLFIAVFINYNIYKYRTYVGVKQFTPFTGWQIANNAIHIYKNLPKIKRKPMPAKFSELDGLVTAYFDSTRDLRNHIIEREPVSTMYMWTNWMPLQTYMKRHSNYDSTEVFKRWASMGPYYGSYGTYLIKTYPIHYLKNYIWPNTLRYYVPPVEFLQTYNTGKDSINVIAQEWFNLKSRKISTRFKSFEVYSLNFLPILAGALNLLFIFSLLFFRILPAYRELKNLRKGILLVAGFWLINFVFSVYASPVSLRFQIFPIILEVVFISFIIEVIIQYSKNVDESFRLREFANNNKELINIKTFS